MDDDDFIVVQSARTSSAKFDPTPLPDVLPNPFTTSTYTPPLSSREESVASSARKSSKRPISNIIDLTLSDDDEPPKPKQVKQARPSLRGGGGPPADVGWHFDDPSQYPISLSSSSPTYDEYGYYQ